MQLVVLGMHRSGTSALTRVLNMMGAHLGRQEVLTAPNAENPRGFWERRDFRSLCDRTLEAGGADWWKVSDFDPEVLPGDVVEPLQGEFAALVAAMDVERPWVVKEPRLCVLLPLFAHLLQMPVYIFPYRDPLETALSLKARNNIPLPMGIALWERYVRDALAATEDQPRLVVRYEDLVIDPLGTVTALHQQLLDLGVTGIRIPSERELTSFLTQGLHRQRANEDGWEGVLTDPQMQLARAVRDGHLQVPYTAVTPATDELLPALEELWINRTKVADLTRVTRDRDNLRKALDTAQGRIEKQNAAVEALKAAAARQTAASFEEMGRLTSERDRTAKALQKDEVAVRTLSRQRDEAVRRHDALRSARSVRLVLLIATTLRGAAGIIRGGRGTAPSAPAAIGDGSRADHDRPAHRLEGAPIPVEVENRRLKQDVMHLRAELADLRARRSVKAAMRVAEALRPAHDVVTGRAGMRDVIGRSRGPSSAIRPAATAAQRPRRTHHDFAPTDTGVFYDRMRALLDAQGIPESFVHEWATSEEDLRANRGSDVTHDQPLVSIVMPTWNRGAIIGDAIGSVTDQTYGNWQLLIGDDGSEDDTAAVVRGIGDDRIVYDRLPKAGAAAARNHGLAQADGELIAYLDTDNMWHPCYLETMVAALTANPGRYAAYAKYVDVFDREGGMTIKKHSSLPFDFERLMTRNFIDLNSVVHRRVLYDRFGGFDEQLPRHQDWDLLIKYSFLRDPLYVDHFLTLYRRNEGWNQITDVQRQTTWTVDAIRERLEGYYRDGLPARTAPTPPRTTIVSWDVCRNHFSKGYNLAECLENPDGVHLLGFRFFDEPVFPPYADARPTFRTTYLDGGELPGWGRSLARAVAAADGEVVYAVKPRLPSLGVALLANYLNGTPVVLELNDLESVVTTPRSGQRSTTLSFADVDPTDPDLTNPYGDTWTALMEGVAARIPHRVTHNRNLDEYFGGGAHIVRNLKDETWFDPSRWDRDAIRAEMGFGPDERVLLFGGMVRKHKGVFQFAELMEKAGPQYRLLVVGSRTTPDQRRLADTAGDRVTILPPADRNEMARINMASDAVVLWLDPAVPASHYQMPYKLTDALAMRVPVLANDISDLGDLGREGYITLVPHGDDRALVEALHAIEADPERTRAMVDRGRRLYLRQFSYRAARTNLGMILEDAQADHGVLDVAEEFARFLAKVREAQGVDLQDLMS